MTKTVVTLEDRYRQETGTVFLTSMQALVRLPVDMVRRDRAAGLKTGGYITGYRGSPITTLDAQLWAASKLLKEHDVRFEPGLNEELAATSLRGTQQLEMYGKSTFQGVFSMWYAKGVGVDRACEALKLANFEGTTKHGGVLVVAGDDHAAKSSASAHQSEHTLIAGFMPVLAPATTDEIISYGMLGWEMSRFSGLYIGMKTLTDTLDLSSTVLLPDLHFPLHLPDLKGQPNLNLQPGISALAQETLVVNHRLPAATQFARLNGLDRLTISPANPRLMIVTAGKPYLDVQQAFRELGVSEARAADMGVGVLKLGLVWPIDGDRVRETCARAETLLVVEEKRPVIEEQLLVALYGGQAVPRILGKRDEAGKALLPSDGVIDSAMVRRAILGRLEIMGLADDEMRQRSARLDALDATLNRIAPGIRPAYFCSGCPHNTSTVVPDGSFAMGATGCHGLAAFMPERRTTGVVGMGAEGMPWVAAQHFVDTPHAFQNMGDGTWNHSGSLAIRASVASKTNVTYKLLYNDAVAMTGGQPLEGSPTVEAIISEMVIEGVNPVVLLSETPERFKPQDLPAGTRVLHRDFLDDIQRELREVKGVSAIVFDQTCANEKRRRRKRGQFADPDKRLWINPAVCEGCGDCSKQSNCMSILPLETEFGRKRAIDQSSCNKDYSCVHGFCPSFVTVTGGKPAKRATDRKKLEVWISKLPEPAVADISQGYSMLVTGIGGTGVLTVGAILGMAAHMEDKAAKVLDMTGMAQKGGGVQSHVRFAPTTDAIPSARLGTGQTDLLLACDLVVASGPDVLKTMSPNARAIANADIVPTAEFQARQDVDLGTRRFLTAVEKRIDADRIGLVHGSALATALMGDSIFTNLLLVGYAAQKGLLPVGLAAIEEAVRLNGTAVEANLTAMALGRIAAVFPDELMEFAGLSTMKSPYPADLATMLESRKAHLTNYQDAALANRYQVFMDELSARVKSRPVINAEPFLMAAADQLSRLLAYKDEYEVARLYSDPKFIERLKTQFDGNFKIAFNLAPPLLPLGEDKRTGRPKKIELGSWMLPAFGVLKGFKKLRGTAFDPFGYTAERRMERGLAPEYQALMLRVAEGLSETTLATAVRIAKLPSVIAGYGVVKEEGLERYRAELPKLLATYEAVPEASAALPKAEPALA